MVMLLLSEEDHYSPGAVSMESERGRRIPL